MRTFIPIFLLIGLLTSCFSDDSTIEPVDLSVYPQLWELSKTTIGMTNTVFTGEEMPFQEKYILYENGEFLKVREDDSGKYELEGVFYYEAQDGKTFLRLNYYEEDAIIGNCTGNNTETLILMKDTNSLVGTWQYCDGPTLEYSIRYEETYSIAGLSN